MKKYLLAILIFVLLSGCSRPDSTPPTLAATPLPSVTTTPVHTATPTITPTPTTPPYPMYPYTLAGLRQRAYPSGTITLRRKLDLNGIYTRWLIDYPSDGLTVTGILQIPQGGPGPFPVIVLNHGYFNRWEYHSGDGADRLAEVLNNAGYITLSSDYRGWGGSSMGPSMFYTGLTVDVLNLIASIPSIPQADPSRVGMLGHSMGGGIASKVLAVDSGAHIRAAILYAPVSADDADIVARWGTGCIGDAAIQTCYGADTLPDSMPAALTDAYLKAAADPQLLRETSPLYHLEWLTVPMQIHIGTADGKIISAVPPEWSKKYYEALEKAQKPAQIFWYEDQGHSFIGDGRELFLQRIVMFFDRWVKMAGD